jgi:beta-lactamase regulating signal transducer with metallopeptidase domain
MSDFLQSIFHPAMVCLGWALVHVLWQGVVIAAALEVALVCAGGRNAQVRYFLCGAALVAMPVCFLVTFWQLSHEISGSGAPTTAISAEMDSSSSALPLTRGSIPVAEDETSEDFVMRSSSTWDWNRVMQGLAAVWLGGVVLLSGRKAGGLLLLWRWRRNGTADPDDEMSDLFQRACGTIGVDPQRVCLKISELVRVPMTMGWWRPIVLFPACLLSGLSAGEIELLLAHELAHIRRCDYLVNLVQAVIETLFFYHPVTWWISRRMRQERENCCDDLVARNSGEALAYAKVLLRLETMQSPGAELVVAASGGVLRQRIERLLGDPARGLAGGVSILLVLVLFGAASAFSFARAQGVLVPRAVSAVVVTETKELEGDVGRLYHAMVYTQTSAEPPKEMTWQFIADMSNNSFPVTGGTVSLPQGSAWATNSVAVVQPGLLVGAHYLYVQRFKAEAELMAQFPNGQYTFNIRATGAPLYKVPVSFTGTVPYPLQAPVITNTTWDAGVLVLDPTSAVINYTNYPGATLTWEIVIPGDHYIMSAGGGGTALGSLDLTGLLNYGQTYVAQLRFINRDKSSTASDPNWPKDYGYSTMMARIVEFIIKTPSGHTSLDLSGKQNRVAAIRDDK